MSVHKASATVSEAIARPVRTAVQVAPSAAITEFIDAFLYDMSDRQYAALIVLLTLVFAWVQATIENAKGRGFLRTVPPLKVPVVEGEVVSPVEDDDPEEHVGEPVDPDHSLDVDSFVEDENQDEEVTR